MLCTMDPCCGDLRINSFNKNPGVGRARKSLPPAAFLTDRGPPDFISRRFLTEAAFSKKKSFDENSQAL